MKIPRLSHAVVLFLVVCFSSRLHSSQETGPASTAANPDRIQIEQALQRYLAALSHRNFDELLTIWPDLDHQKKECGNIKRHLQDSSVSDDRISVQPLEIVANGDGALVRVKRTEEFVKTEHVNSAIHGTLVPSGVPMHDPSTESVERKKNIKKIDTVWVKLHREGQSWTIISISERKPVTGN